MASQLIDHLLQLKAWLAYLPSLVMTLPVVGVIVVLSLAALRSCAR